MIFRASKAIKWLDCPARAAGEPDSTSMLASRGTLGHEFMRAAALGHPDIFEAAERPRLAGAAGVTEEHNAVPPEEVLTLKTEVKAFLERHEMPAKLLGVEYNFGYDEPMRLHETSPHLWMGTVDLVYLDHLGRLCVRDYKFGWGTYSAATSLQLRVYALAALIRFDVPDKTEVIIEYALMRTGWIDRHRVPLMELYEYALALDGLCSRMIEDQWNDPIERVNQYCGDCALALTCETFKTSKMQGLPDPAEMTDAQLSDAYAFFHSKLKGFEKMKAKINSELLSRYFKSRQTKDKIGQLSIVRRKDRSFDPQEAISYLIENYEAEDLIANGVITIGKKAANALAKKDPKLLEMQTEKPNPHWRINNK